jgi:hypothetical protein
LQVGPRFSHHQIPGVDQRDSIFFGKDREVENNLIVPSVLLFTAVVELAMTPFVMGKIKGPQKLIVGGAMLMGSVITAGIGVAFWMGWIGG